MILTTKERKELLKLFEKQLHKEGASYNTIVSYCWAVNDFYSRYDTLSHTNLLKYREMLIHKNSPQTVNLRLLAMNRYLKTIKRNSLKLKVVKIQKKPFIENVISEADYKFLKRRLRKDGRLKYYFLVWFMGATGARVSEVINFKVENLSDGYMDIYGKGMKFRRIYIPKRLQTEALKWVKAEGRNSGYLFLNNLNEQISPKGIGKQLQKYGTAYGIDKAVLHPHSFRHMFAKKFLKESNGNIFWLGDILGHSSLDSTKIYLQLSAREQYDLFNSIVNW